MYFRCCGYYYYGRFPYYINVQIHGGHSGRTAATGHRTSGHSPPPYAFGGEDLFPSDIEKIARIGFGLASNHAFLDGNKRIGAMMTQLLLKWNGYQLRLKQGELADMFIAIADGTSNEQDLLNWIQEHT